MSKTEDNEREYIEEFTREYRAGHKEFVKATSLADQEIIDQTLFMMEHYESEKKNHERAKHRTPLTIEEASKLVKKNWLGHKDHRRISNMLTDDYMERKGTDEDIAAHGFKVWLDKARSRKLFGDSEDVTRKYRECAEKNAELNTTINGLRANLKKCEEDFAAYRQRIKPLGSGKTETGGTDEAPPPVP